MTPAGFLLRWVLPAMALAGGLWGVYLLGSADATRRLSAVHSAEIAGMRQAAAEAQSAAEQQAREAERAAVLRLNEVEAKYHAELQSAVAEQDRLLAALRAGELRLHDRFSCPGGGGVSAAASGAGGGGRSAGGGLSEKDVRFLVSIAGEADQVVRQLQACQAALRSDRALR